MECCVVLIWYVQVLLARFESPAMNKQSLVHLESNRKKYVLLSEIRQLNSKRMFDSYLSIFVIILRGFECVHRINNLTPFSGLLRHKTFTIEIEESSLNSFL